MSYNETQRGMSLGEDVFTEWMDGWISWPRPWAEARNCDGRPIWEPPILDYSEYIGEEHEKKRKAMLEYTGGDVARTTEIMDADTEERLLWEYRDWAEENAESAVDDKSRKFFSVLPREVWLDWRDAGNEWCSFDGGLYYKRNDDGTYYVYAPQAGEKAPIHPYDVSQTSVERSPSASSNDASDSDSLHNIITSQRKAQQDRRISSPNEDAEEMAWLDSIETAASTSSPLITNPIQPRNNTPLALRLLAWLDSLDASASTFVTKAQAQPRDTTPLALRLVAIRTQDTFIDAKHQQRETTEDDDVD